MNDDFSGQHESLKIYKAKQDKRAFPFVISVQKVNYTLINSLNIAVR